VIILTEKEKDQKIPIRSHTTPSGPRQSKAIFTKTKSTILPAIASPRLAIPAIPSPVSDSLSSAACRPLRRRKISAAFPRDFSRVFWSFLSFSHDVVFQLRSLCVASTSRHGSRASTRSEQGEGQWPLEFGRSCAR